MQDRIDYVNTYFVKQEKTVLNFFPAVEFDSALMLPTKPSIVGKCGAVVVPSVDHNFKLYLFQIRIHLR